MLTYSSDSLDHPLDAAFFYILSGNILNVDKKKEESKEKTKEK